MSRRFFLALMVFALLGFRPFLATGQAATGNTPSDFIRYLGDQAIAVLQQPGTTLEQRETRFRELLATGFDMEFIGRFVMGNTHEEIIGGTFSIQIDTKSNIAWATADTTLLHEMCHVKTYDRTVELDQDMHGPLFKACIVNLELQGAFTDLL